MIEPAPDATPTFYEQLVALERSGVAFVLVALVESKGSVPQDTGAKMLVTAVGVHTGTVGGGRVEARAIEHARAMLARPEAEASRPEFIAWTLKTDVGMTCGGAVKLYFEPHPSAASLWTIAIFGAGHVAQALIPVLAPLPCRLLCYDNRPEWLARLPAVRNLQREHHEDLASVIDALPASTFLLCMTQGHKTDRPILLRALGTRKFPYIGVIGSESKAEILRRELVADGLSAERARQFHCPVGLPFGTNHPHEIALSIAAQLLAERDRRG